jgi:hypothetical protein
LLGILLAICPGVALAQLELAVRTVDHPNLRGRLERFDLETGLVIRNAAGESISVPVADLVSIDSGQPRIGEGARNACVVLQDTERMYGRITGGGEDAVQLELAFGRKVSIPLERVRACLSSRAGELSWKRLVQQLLHQDRVEDELLLTNGDRIRGFLDRIEDTEVIFEASQGPITVSKDVLVAVVLGSEPQQPSSDQIARVQFSDGSTLRVSAMRWDAGGFEMTSFDGTWQGLPGSAVASIEILDSRWRWLSGMTPHSFEHTPQLALTWPLGVDRNARGRALRLGGRTYTRGLGVHSKSVLRYQLDGQFSRFLAVAGLDDSAGDYGDVHAVVIVDGEPRWRRDHMRAKRAPEQIEVDLTGARMLELHVDFGANGDLQDYFNWADAGLVR